MNSIDIVSLANNIGRRRQLPILRQAEASECGLACIAMIGWFWGLRFDVAALRQRFMVSSRGVNLSTIIKIANSLGLTTRALRAEVDDLRHLRLPAILHWEFKHFVVLKSIGRQAVVHDPKIGVRHISLKELQSKFTGVALEIWPSSEFSASDSPKPISWRELIGRPQGLLKFFTKLILVGAAIEIITLVLPVVTQWGIDNVASSGDIDLLTILAIGMGVMIVLQTVLTGIRGWSIASATTSYILQWKMHIFAHMTTLPMRYFELRRVGSITARYDSVERIIGIVNDSFVEGLLDSSMGLITVFVLFLYNVPLTLITVLGALIYAVVRIARYSTVRELTQDNLIADAKENSSLIETIRGMRPIKLFAREKGREQEWVSAAVDEANATLALSQTQVLFKMISGIIGGLEQVIVFWFSLQMVTQGRMTIGMLFAFIAYRGQFYSSVSGLVDNYISLQTVKIHADRVADIILAEPEELNAAHNEGGAQTTERVGKLSGTVELQEVSFRYGEFEPFALRSISLHFAEGENIAIVGKSGCGKSSLLSLIVGLNNPYQGHVLFGGIPIRSLGLATVRRHVGVVMQDDILFSGTIAQNIAAFDSVTDIDHVAACARLAGFHIEILAMPMGYGTIVSDLGSSLSGGQRQRVCIARALYKKPKVLLMDEATSHLDVETERFINNNIRNLGITRIIVAHRVETIRSADRLIMLADGSVVADAFTGVEYESIIDQISGASKV